MQWSTVEVSGKPHLVPKTDDIVWMEPEGREAMRLSCTDSLTDCCVASPNSVALVATPPKLRCTDLCQTTS